MINNVVICIRMVMKSKSMYIKLCIYLFKNIYYVDFSHIFGSKELNS